MTVRLVAFSSTGVFISICLIIEINPITKTKDFMLEVNNSFICFLYRGNFRGARVMVAINSDNKDLHWERTFPLYMEIRVVLDVKSYTFLTKNFHEALMYYRVLQGPCSICLSNTAERLFTDFRTPHAISFSSSEPRTHGSGRVCTLFILFFHYSHLPDSFDAKYWIEMIRWSDKGLNAKGKWVSNVFIR